MPSKHSSHGGLREPIPPLPGDRFWISETELRTVDVLEFSGWIEGDLTVFLVRTRDGQRWTLVPRDPILDGIWFHGTPLPRVTD
jgi:hypothetical protein